MAEMDFFGGKKSCLKVEKHILGAAHPMLHVSAAVHGTSQVTTTCGATHSLQEPLLL